MIFSGNMMWKLYPKGPDMNYFEYKNMLAKENGEQMQFDE